MAAVTTEPDVDHGHHPDPTTTSYLETTHSIFGTDKGILGWLGTLDHKRIGIMYLVIILTAFFVAGMLALILRVELFFPGRTIMDAKTYNQIFTLHGVMMVFIVIIPS